MNLRDLKYIVEVAKERNFSNAAKKVFVSQPTLTMQIQKLEDELGVKIFERQNKNFLITEVGELIIKTAQEILDKEKELKELAKEFKDPFSGELRIGAFPTLASYYFPKITKKILQEFPKLKLLLVEEKTDELIKKLKNGEIDCAFLAMPVLEENLNHVEIFEEEFLLAVSKNNPLAKQTKSVSTIDLKNESLMLLEDGHCLRNQALEACSLLGNFTEKQDFKASSLETLRQMVAMNYGVTLMPEIAINKSDGISYLELSTKPTRKIALYYRKSSVKTKLFTEIAKHIR